MRQRPTTPSQPTMTTYTLGVGAVVMYGQEVCRVLATYGCDDGSIDLRLEGDMDEDRTVNVPLSSLGEPLWRPVAHKHCARDAHTYWLAWGFDLPGGPHWCDGQHR